MAEQNPLSGILIMDKPEGFTSFDVIGKLRGLLHTKKMGHTGTLDPMATGVLPIFIGKGTKAISFLEDHDKRYTAEFRLGLTTDTQDITGKTLTTSDKEVTRYEVELALASFVGKHRQLPPMYSAVKVDGKRLYELARKGQEVKRPSREVQFHEISLLEADELNKTYLIDVRCSKGTYIRTLCHDVGQKLGCGAILTKLRRTEACGYDLAQSITFGEIEELAQEDKTPPLLPVETAFTSFPRGEISASKKAAFLNGQKLPPENFQVEAEIELGKPIAIYYENHFLGLAEHRQDEPFIRPIRIF